MYRLRRTLLYIPGNNPALINSSGLYGADTIVFDLEDSVSINQKDAARNLIKHALRNLSFINPSNKEIMVRINSLDTPFGKNDIIVIVKERPASFRIPKVESDKDIHDIEELVSINERSNNIDEGTIKFVPIIESIKGLVNIFSIVQASKRIDGVTLGAEDFTRDMGTTRTREGTELQHARGQILLAAKSSGIQAIDTVFSDVNDTDGLISETKLVKQMGFDGKSVIHPRQVNIIHDIYNPTQKEIKEAQRIMKAIKEANEKGSGVISIDGKMIDPPVVKRAERIVSFAQTVGLISQEEQL